MCVCVRYLQLVESFDKPPYCHNNIIDRGISPFGFLRSLGGFHKSYFRQIASSLHLLFSYSSKFFFSVTCFRTFFADPIPFFNWWAVSVAGEELKWRQMSHHQLMSQQGPHFSTCIKLKPIIKAQISGKLVASGISDVAIDSVYFEKIRLKKIIIIIG